MWTFRYVIIVIRKAVSVMNSINKCKVTRRTFIKIGGAITAAAICGCGFELKNLYTIDDINPDPNVGDAGVQVIRTACMMCNAGCGLQIKVKDGAALMIEGNPFFLIPMTILQQEQRLSYLTFQSQIN